MNCFDFRAVRIKNPGPTVNQSMPLRISQDPSKLTKTCHEKTFHDVFLRQWDSANQQFVMAFGALSNEGEAIWRTGVPERQD